MGALRLLRGKISPPQQGVPLHPRPRLINQLAPVDPHKLTLIEAPAGFGKTTLLTQWRDQLLTEQKPVAWLTLDGDDTPERIIAYIAWSLREAGLDVAATGTPGSEPDNLPAAAPALSEVLDALACDARGTILMIDDLQRLTNPDAQRQLETLIQYAPTNLRIAIAARSNPGLALAHWSLMGLVTHLDASNLRFTAAEMHAYLSKAAAAVDVRPFMERAEGWPVAVQIVRSQVLSAQTSGDSVEGVNTLAGLVTAYFTEELVERLTPDQQSFLCDISLLEGATLALTDHVREAADSARILRELAPLIALISPPHSAAGPILLHPLLREYFAARANADPARCLFINRRAAQWFAAARKLPLALRYAVAAGDKMLTGALMVLAGGVSIWIRQGMVEVVAANQLIDDAMIAAMPRLGLIRSIVLIKQSRLHEAREQYERVAAATDGFSRDPASADAAALRREGLFILSMLVIYCCLPLSEAHLLSLDKGLHNPAADDVELAHHKTVLCVTYLQSGNFDAAWRYGEEAAAHCRAVGSIYGTNFVDFHTGSIAMARGATQQAAQLYQKGRRKSRRHFGHDVGLRLIGDVLTAELDLERNAILHVKHRLAQLIDRLHDAEAWFEIYAAAYGAASEVYLLERGLDETLAFLDQAQARAEHLRLTKLGPVLDAFRVTALTQRGDTDRAWQVAIRSPTDFAAAGLDKGTGPAWREVESLSTAWVRLLLRRKRYAEALHTADTALSFARTRGLARMALRLNVLAAMSAEARGERADAMNHIAAVCAEVARTGYLRAVLREGAELTPLLREAGRILPSETLRRQALDLVELLSGEAESALRTPVFSPRELDVLLHLNGGMQDKLIARRLGVSEHAVRFHLKNIYAKTQSHTRFEAVARARELGVLSPRPS
jgi:LuxR family maltose regulon positive regulatory protein